MKRLFFGLLSMSGTLMGATFKIGLDWMVNPLHLIFVIGIEGGHFANENINIELVPYKSYTEAVRHLATDDVDAILMDQGRFEFYRKKFNLVSIHTIIYQPLEVMVSRYEIKDLKNKTIAHQSSGTGKTIADLQDLLAAHNVSAQDVKILYTKENLSSTFVYGGVDAVLNVMRPFQLAAIQKKCHGTKVYYLSHDPGQMLIGKYGGVVPNKLCSAVENVRQWILKNPKVAMQMYIKKYPDQKDLLTDENFMAMIELIKVDWAP
jgi:putative hydroxymethylpyrimidine transport system substrate-binding protein